MLRDAGPGGAGGSPAVGEGTPSCDASHVCGGTRASGGRAARAPRVSLWVCVAVLAFAAGCGGDGDGGARNDTPAPTSAFTALPTVVPTEVSTAAPTTTTAPTPVPTTVPTMVPTVQGGPIAMRRLTAAQYKASIADLLGDFEMLVAARRDAFGLDASDPELAGQPELLEEVRAVLGDLVEWLFVS